MKTITWIVALMLVSGLASAAQLYKWLDKDGNLHYTDQPPPPEAKTTEQKSFGDKPADGPAYYALQQAVKNFPVTLYTAAGECGEACNKASALLNQRGVPFSEKSARDPAAAEELKALTGGKLMVPVMKVGTQVLSGYEESGWNATLDAAGYPKWAVTPTRPTPKKPAQAEGKPGTAPAQSATQSSVAEPATR